MPLLENDDRKDIRAEGPEALFPLGVDARPLAISLAVEADTWVKEHPELFVLSPSDLRVPLESLPSWRWVRPRPPEELAAVLLRACRELRRCGWQQASWRGPNLDSIASLPVALSALSEVAPLVIDTARGRVPAQFFASLTPGLQARYIPDPTERARCVSLAETGKDMGALAWAFCLSAF